MNPRLTVAFPRKSNGRTIHRALASLEGAAKEAIPMLRGLPPGMTSSTTDRADFDLAKECESLGVELVRHAIGFEGMVDEPATYNHFLPEKNAKGATLCTGKMISSSLSDVANELLHAASGDYVLFMGPGEVCLDPVNIIRALDFMDTQPQIDVVSCPVKVYSGGEHVKTIMAPKIFRRNKGQAVFTGVLADNWEPCNDINWLISASGFTFMDHGDAWADPAAADLLDLKLLLSSYVFRAWPEDDLGRAKAIVAGTKICQLLARWSSGGAYVIASGVIDNHRAKTPDIVPALIARARSCWRYDAPDVDNAIKVRGSSDLDRAMTDLNLAIEIWPTAAALLERGFLKHGVENDWKEDLIKGVEAAKQTTSYGLDMRELALAEEVVRARPEGDPKRCQEKVGADQCQCLLDADGHNKHEGMDCGMISTWYDP